MGLYFVLKLVLFLWVHRSRIDEGYLKLSDSLSAHFQKYSKNMTIICRYGRSLHARIEEQGHKFSFDCHDPGVFMSAAIPSLMEHYKDPAACMFFEPMLCQAVNRRDPFPLQFLARATLADSLSSYSSIDRLELPKSLKTYLKEYHYRHKVRVRRLDLESSPEASEDQRSVLGSS